MTDLTITQQALDDRQVRLTVTVPADRTEQAMREAARRLAKNYRFPGFRPGKAPYHIVVQRIGRAALLEEAIEEMGNSIYQEALATTGLEPFAPGSLTNVTPDPVTLTFDVPLPPIADPGDYRSLRLDVPPVDEAEIEEHLQADLSQMDRGRTTWTPVDRPIQYGDLVTISLKLTVDGEVALENEDWDFSPDAEDFTLVREFDDAFIGMSSGESKSFAAVFPEDGDSQWAGKEGQFEVAVKAVQGKAEPSYDDAFAVEHGFESAEDMFQKLREHAASHVEENAKSKYYGQVMDALLEGAALSYPPAAVDNKVDLLMAEQEAVFRAYGFESMEEVLRLQNRTEEDFRADLRPEAERRLRRDLVLDAIVGREHFPVSDYELDQWLVSNLSADPNRLAEMQQTLATNLAYRDWLASRIQRHKAEELIQAIARGEEVPAPGQHQAEEAPPVAPEPEPAAEAAAPEAEAAPIAETPDEAGPEAVASAEEPAEIEAASQPAEETETTVVPAS